MARGHVVAQSCDDNGNAMGRPHANPIVNTRMHKVDGKVTELTVNVIAESMYAQCDTDRNEYLLLIHSFPSLIRKSVHKNVKVALEILPEGKKALISHPFVQC